MSPADELQRRDKKFCYSTEDGAGAGRQDKQQQQQRNDKKKRRQQGAKKSRSQRTMNDGWYWGPGL